MRRTMQMRRLLLILLPSSMSPWLTISLFENGLYVDRSR